MTIFNWIGGIWQMRRPRYLRHPVVQTADFSPYRIRQIHHHRTADARRMNIEDRKANLHLTAKDRRHAGDDH